MNDVWIAIVLQIGTLLGLLITALVGRSKVEEVHKLVNGQSDRQERVISSLQADVRALTARKRPGRPRKSELKSPPPTDSAVGGTVVDPEYKIDGMRRA